MVYLINTLNLVYAALCLIALGGAYYANRDNAALWSCPVERTVVWAIGIAAALFIVNCFI